MSNACAIGWKSVPKQGLVGLLRLHLTPRLQLILRVMPALFLLSACGPITVAEAERQCFERARLAQQPRGEISIGVNSSGQTAGGIALEVSSDYIQGRDPSAVYESCVVAKSGEPPSRPLYARPDWKG